VNVSAGLGAFRLSASKLGLWLFMAVVTILFSALISAYVVRMGLPDWRALPEPGVLWFNTALLVLSSVALQWSRGQSALRELRGVWLGALLGLLFVLGQFWAWAQLYALGYFVTSNPSNSFFYLITALHGLHLVGGLGAWVWVGVRAKSGLSKDRFRANVALCTTYWHFLLLVWLVLFALMLLT